MHRERQQPTDAKPGRPSSPRKEWRPNPEQQHQMEAREHARQHGKLHRTFDIRAREAERQIREIRGRY